MACQFLGILDVGGDDDVSVVDGEPHAPDGQPADVRDLQVPRQGQQDVLVASLLKARRVLGSI
jgi:hypothetical protein